VRPLFQSNSAHFKYQSLLVFAVLVAYAPIALINQPLWDDWVILAYFREGTLWELFKQLGRREQYALMEPFAASGDPRFWTASMLLLFCALAPLIYTIIRKVTAWPPVDAFWAALLTALVPLNQARFVLSTVPYAFSCLFFALALVVLLRDLNVSSVFRRLLVVLLLTMAFSTNSFLVLGWIPPAIVAVEALRKVKNPGNAAQVVLAITQGVGRRLELVLLPLLYWQGKKLLEPTYGLYEHYNTFHMGVFAALWQTLIAFFTQLREGSAVLIPDRSDIFEIGIVVALAIAIFAVAAKAWNLPLATRDEQHDRRLTAFVAVAALALIVSAIFPYVIVGQPPRFAGLWETRHQTTLMMVSGFAIFASLRLFVPAGFYGQ
jgi:hypothetical protein